MGVGTCLDGRKPRGLARSVVSESKLPDVLGLGLGVVFCGTAAGTQSALRRAYYAGSGNRFWSILYETGLVATKLRPEEYGGVLAYGIGLTDVCKAHAGMDNELPSGAFDVAGLRAKIAEIQPRVIAFNGKKAARVALDLEPKVELSYGAQSESFTGVEVWVLPSTSRAANGSWDAAPWHA